MFNFFQSIFDTISVLLKFLVSFVEGLIDFVGALVQGSAYLLATVALLPSPIVATAMTVIAVGVIYMILNR